MTDLSFNRWYLEGILKDNVCNVKFTRVSGGTSSMKCTLKSEYLPEYHGDQDRLDKAEQKRKDNEIIAVWNLDKKGWRCFKIENLIDLEIVDALPV